MNFFKRKQKQIDLSNLPNHTAFIIDGNGRWAKKRGLPRTLGHKQGVKAVKQTIQNCYDLGIKIISFFCFSTENWNRPKDEIDALFDMLNDFLVEDISIYKNKGIKFIVSGDITKLPINLQNGIINAINETQSCNKMLVNLCINYGGQSEILQVVNTLIKQGKSTITKQDFECELFKNNLAPIDLVVRTSGEERISNFMLWQLAYAELYFTKTYWPDFNSAELEKAIVNFQSRTRRFGAIK